MDSSHIGLKHPKATLGLVLWLGVLAMSFYNFQPLLIGGIITELKFSALQAGLVASSNLLGVGVALVAFAAGFGGWKGDQNNRRLLVVAMCLLGFGNLLSIYCSSFNSLIAVRFFAGLGEGLIGAIATSCIVFFRKPDRVYGLVMVVMSLYGMVGHLVLPHVLTSYGLGGVFAILAALPLVSLPIFRLLPEANTKGSTSDSSVLPLLAQSQTLLILLSVMLVYVSCNGIWGYYERIGAVIGIALEDIGVSLSLALFASLVGGMLAAVLSNKFGRLLPITIGMLLAAVSMFVLYHAEGFISYTLSIMLLFGATGFVLPYYMGQLAVIDSSGKLPVIALISMNIGNFSGPAVAGFIVQAESYSSHIAFSGGVLVLALGLTFVAFQQNDRSSPVLIPNN